MPKHGPHGRDPHKSGLGLSLESIWHWMTGSLIGLIGAALLLVADPGAAAILFAVTSAWLSKLLFLFLSGFCCGGGATVTGAIFLLVER